MIPLTAMVGSAVDVSRGYLVKTRLQQACDAGALAGRRVMTGATLDAAAKQQAQNFFNANVKNGLYGAENVEVAVTDVAYTTNTNLGTGKVHGSAKAEVPTTLMRIFGKQKIAMSAECEAQLNISNNDIMFVLDTTGSMGTMAGSVTRIEGLRQAVISFFNIVKDATSGGARLRVGFVPYSSQVNVGYLLQPMGAIRTGTYPYQSRQFLSQQEVITRTETGTDKSDQGSLSDCQNWANNYGNNPISWWDGGNKTTINYSYNSWDSSKKKCTRNYKIDTSRIETKWTHKSIYYDISAFSSGGTVSNPAQSPATLDSWDGCVEERQEGTHDIHMKADSPDRRWAPAWARATFRRDGTPDQVFDHDASNNRAATNNYVCPKAATRLAELTKQQVAQYVSAAAGFVPNGSTYHDFGMIWGARLMSTKGVFASDHGAAPNGKPVLRHIVFMTDGSLQPSDTTYTQFGIEALDHRIGSSSLPGSSVYWKHDNRFLQACADAKADNISIWAVSFGLPLSDEMKACASTGQAFEATDAAELNSRFQYIASRIAELRLSQ